MVTVDLSGNPRIPILLDMVLSIRRSTSARGVLESFLRGIQLAFGPRCYIGISKRGAAADEYRIVRWLTLDQGENVKPADIGEEVFDTPLLRGGFLGELTADGFPKLIHHLDIRDDTVVGNRLSRYGSLIAVPLIEADMSFDWAIVLHEAPEAFTAADLETMIIRANLINAAVDNVHMNEKLMEATQRIHREVDQIAKIQTLLLPKNLPALPNHTLAASYKTFDRAGGDYYDVFSLEKFGGGQQENRWVMLIADAAGHGPSAAVIMAVFHSILHTFRGQLAGPAHLLEYINQHLYSQFAGSALMTAFLGCYDPVARNLVYANAGHPSPLVRRERGSVVELETTEGFPLGIQSSAGLTELTITLQPGQTLLMYTDGVPDERSSEVVPFGLDRLKEILMSHGDPATLLPEINEQLVAHQGLTPPEDDQTLLAARVDAAAP